MRAVGIHLVQSVDLIDTPRRSVVVEIDAEGVLSGVATAAHIDEIVAAVGHDPALVLVDAPLEVTNARGQRDVERILAWCDVPAFPVSLERMHTVYGGLRGVELAAALPSSVTARETHPDLALRLMMWEEQTGGGAIDLGEYRTRWLELRAPAFRPRGPGRATPAGILAATAIIARHVDLAGWSPSGADDDWAPIRDAAILDAILCAWVARRHLSGTDPPTMRIGTPSRGQLLLPVDANLRNRLTLTVTRLTAEGTIQA